MFSKTYSKKNGVKTSTKMTPVKASVEVKALTIQSCSEARTSTIGLKVRDLPDLPTKYLSRLVSTTFQWKYSTNVLPANARVELPTKSFEHVHLSACQTVRLSVSQIAKTPEAKRRPASVRLRPELQLTCHDVFSLLTCQETFTAIWQRNLTQIMSKKKSSLRLLRWKGGLCIAGTTPTWRTTFLQSHTSYPISNNDSRRNIQLSNLKQGTSDSNLAKRIQRTCSWSFKKKRWHWKPCEIAQNPTQSPNKIRNSVICAVQNTQNHRWLRLHRCITPKGSTKVIATKGQLERPRRECQKFMSCVLLHLASLYLVLCCVVGFDLWYLFLCIMIPFPAPYSRFCVTWPVWPHATEKPAWPHAMRQAKLHWQLQTNLRTSKLHVVFASSRSKSFSRFVAPSFHGSNNLKKTKPLRFLPIRMSVMHVRLTPFESISTAIRM